MSNSHTGSHSMHVSGEDVTVGTLNAYHIFLLVISTFNLYWFQIHLQLMYVFWLTFMFSSNYLHLCFPFKEIEGSQDDLLRLIHSSEIVLAISRRFPVTDVEPEKQIGRIEINIQRLRYHVKIEPNDRTILLTAIINCTCKITHKRDWKWSWTLNCINSVYNSQPCNIIGCCIK